MGTSYLNEMAVLVLLSIGLLGVQFYLSLRKNIYLGLILPIIFAIVSGYCIYIEYIESFIDNPYPKGTSAYNTLISIICLGFTIVIFFICKVIKNMINRKKLY